MSSHYPLADDFFYSHHMSDRQMYRYYKVKFDVNQSSDLKC